jgi:hypothetical protein
MASKHIKGVFAAAAATVQEVPIFVNGAGANAQVSVGAEDQLVIEDLNVSTTVAGVIHVFHGVDGTNTDPWRTLFNGEIVGTRASPFAGLRVLPKGHKIFVIGPATGTCYVQVFGVIN